MEYKKVNSLVRQVREDVGMTQKEARCGVLSPAAYSKMENGKKLLRFEELIGILQNLCVPVNDFFTDYVQAELTDTTRIQFVHSYLDYCKTGEIGEIVDIYQRLSENFPELNSDQFGVYFDIKNTFHKKYPEEICSVTHKELDIIFKFVMKNKRKRFFNDDYRLISHTIMDMESVKIMKILNKIFPLNREIELSMRIKENISNIFLNCLTPMLERREFESVSQILDIAKDHAYLYEGSYYFKMHISYLENLYLFVTTGNVEHMEKINHFIGALEMVEDEDTVAQIREEITSIITMEESVGLSEHNVIINQRIN